MDAKRHVRTELLHDCRRHHVLRVLGTKNDILHRGMYCCGDGLGGDGLEAGGVEAGGVQEGCDHGAELKCVLSDSF